MLSRSPLRLVLVALIVLVLLPTVLLQAQSIQITVKVATLNVRSGPGKAYPILGTLAKGDVVDATGRSADRAWLVIQYQGADGWIANLKANVSVTGDIRTLPVIKAPPKPTKAAAQAASAGNPSAMCSNVRATCSQLSSCDEAKACLAAGNRKLDRDGDGVPCESLCK